MNASHGLRIVMKVFTLIHNKNKKEDVVMASKEYQKVLNGDINRKEDSINAARPTSNIILPKSYTIMMQIYYLLFK